MATDKDLSIFQRLFAASGASLAAAAVTNPLEVLKTRVQAEATASTAGQSCPNARWRHARHPIADATHMTRRSEPAVVFRGSTPPQPTTLSVFRDILREGGPRAFWVGLRPTLLSAVPMVGIYMPLYDVTRDLLEPSIGGAAPLVASSAARAVAVCCVAPLEVLRTQLMSQRPAAAATATVSMPGGGACGCITAPAAPPAQPLRLPVGTGWTRGLNATLLRDVPFTAIFWSITEPTRRALTPHGDAPVPTSTLLYANMAAAGTGGAIAAALTTPFDVIKTQQQILPKRLTLLETARNIHATRGAAGFFVGVWPRSARAVPAGAIVVSTYELLKARFVAASS